ncbi:MAG: HEPN domain-containing protein [Anaerolineae bacterium]
MAETERGKWLRESRAGYLTAPERDTVANLLDQLERECRDQIARVILFGSRARGDYEPESDIDLLIVTRDGKSEVDGIIKHLSRDEPYWSILVMSAEQYQEHQWLRDPLYVNVRRDGVELWDPKQWRVEEEAVPLDFEEGEPRVMDKATKETINIYLGLARDALDDARYLRKGKRLRATNSKAYYAAHYALVAALFALNVVRSKHSGVQAALSQFLVKPGHIEEEHKDIFKELREIREDSDYEPRFVPDEAQTVRLLAGAERFVARMEEFLKEHGAFDNDEEDSTEDG